MVYTRSATTSGPASPSPIRVQGLWVDSTDQPADQVEGRRSCGRFLKAQLQLNSAPNRAPRLFYSVVGLQLTRQRVRQDENFRCSSRTTSSNLSRYTVAQHKISPLGRALGSQGGKKGLTIFGVTRCSDAQFCQRKGKISGDVKQVVLICQASPIHHSHGLIVLQPGSSSLMEHRW